MRKPKPRPTLAEIDAARLADRERHAVTDAQFLFDLLFARAEKGDRRARRLLVRLGFRLARWGAVLRAPTWEPYYAPSRLHEIGLS